MIELLRVEQRKGTLKGVIVQLGGQTPLKLAAALEEAGIPILGTSPDAIDLAEDRERFQVCCRKLGLRQPANGLRQSRTKPTRWPQKIGYPVLIRPHYVLGGRAMEIVSTTHALDRYMREAVVVSRHSPRAVRSAICRTPSKWTWMRCATVTNVYVAGIMQHIEEAGIHSGDSACSLPPFRSVTRWIDELSRPKLLGQGAQRGRPDERAVRHQRR